MIISAENGVTSIIVIIELIVGVAFAIFTRYAGKGHFDSFEYNIYEYELEVLRNDVIILLKNIKKNKKLRKKLHMGKKDIEQEIQNLYMMDLFTYKEDEDIILKSIKINRNTFQIPMKINENFDVVPYDEKYGTILEILKKYEKC